MAQDDLLQHSAVVRSTGFAAIGAGGCCQAGTRMIAMKRPMGTATGAGQCDGCMGYSGHRLPSTRRRCATDCFPVTWAGGIDPLQTPRHMES